MSRRPVQLLIDDIREAIGKVERYTSGLTAEQFLRDEKTADAVVRNLEIIGEAASRIPEVFKQQHGEIEWAKIVGLRHRIVHDYFGIDLQIVWQVIQVALPQFKTKLERLCSSAPS